MKLIRSFLTLLLLITSVAVMAQEPQLVVVNGKKCIIHTIGQGDTLYSLAKQYDVPLKNIMELNNSVKADSLLVGTSIYVPYNAKAYKRAMEQQAAEGEGAENKFIDHTIAAGDTLYSIAKHYKIELEAIMTDNEGVTAESLVVGDIIKIRKSLVGTVSIKDIDKDIKRREGDDKLSEQSQQESKGEAKRSKGKADEEKSEEGPKFKQSDRVAEGMEKSEEQPEEAEQREEQDREIMGISIDSLLHIDRSSLLPTHEQEIIADIDSLQQRTKVRIPDFQRFNKGEVLNVALMLPMHRGDKVVGTFVDFYRGSLLALEDLRRHGYSINVTAYDTQRSAIRISEILESEEFAKTNLIIGPVYLEELVLVVPYAEERSIPVVTPLTDVNPAELTSPVLFQMKADEKYKYEKYAHMFDGSHKINIVYGPTNDAEFLQSALQATEGLEVRHINATVGGRGASFFLRNEDGTNGASVPLSSFMDAHGRSVVIIVADRDYHIEKMLSTIGEQVKKRRRGEGDCVVVGNRKWDNLDYIERTGFFRSAVTLLTPYNSKRTDNNAIKLFESRYLSTYGILPTPFSCRGYDAFMLFCTKMFTGLDKYIVLETITPLATPYKFKFEDGMWVNKEWVIIQYERDFTVSYR